MLWEQKGIRNSLFWLFLQLICGSELFLNRVGQGRHGGVGGICFHPRVLFENFYKEGRTYSSGEQG